MSINNGTLVDGGPEEGVRKHDRTTHTHTHTHTRTHTHTHTHTSTHMLVHTRCFENSQFPNASFLRPGAVLAFLSAVFLQTPRLFENKFVMLDYPSQRNHSEMVSACAMLPSKYIHGSFDVYVTSYFSGNGNGYNGYQITLYPDKVALIWGG